MIKVMFVCHGNICRSPMAEFVFKHMVRVFLQDLPANAVKSRVSDSQYTVLTTKLNIFHLSKCFDYKRIRAFFVLPHRFHCSLFMRIVT